MDAHNRLTPFESMVIRRVEKLEKRLLRQSAQKEWAKGIQQKSR